MKIGVDGELNDDTLPVSELASAVEDAGLDSLFVIQRTHLPVSRRDLLEQEGHEMDANLLDPFVALGAAAAVTSRIELGTGACYVAVYDPLILARQVATIDQISGGRFLFGITPGWDELEIRNHGVDPALRWRVTREKVLALKALWTEPEAEFHGRFVEFEPVLLGLKPVQEPHPPILVGSHGPRGLARAAEYGDEWFPVMSSNLDLEADMEELARLCRQAGRDPLPVTVFLWELDEEAVERCANAGVARCLIYLYPERRDAVDSFLERCAALASRFT